MKRGLRPEEHRLWAAVAATVRPSAGRAAPKPSSAEFAAALDPHAPPLRLSPAARPAPRPVPPASEPAPIEPGRRRLLVRELEVDPARLDLHGLDQDRARAVLEAFLRRAQAEGRRAALVITGKGLLGDGVLRRRAPEWLAAPALRDIVAGVSEAGRRHGGAGALYVALKRRPR